MENLDQLLSVVHHGVNALAITSVLKSSITKIGGAATDELIGLFQDASQDDRRMKQFMRQLKMFEDATEELKKRKIDPKSVPLKVLVPMLEGARFEEDPKLSKKWAALLANAASGQTNVSQLPSFSDVLRQLSPAEARLIDLLYSQSAGHYGHVDISNNFGFKTEDESRIVIENMYRLLLLKGGIIEHPEVKANGNLAVISRGLIFHSQFVATWEQTRFGRAFVEACRMEDEHKHLGG